MLGPPEEDVQSEASELSESEVRGKERRPEAEELGAEVEERLQLSPHALLHGLGGRGVRRQFLLSFPWLFPWCAPPYFLGIGSPGPEPQRVVRTVEKCIHTAMIQRGRMQLLSERKINKEG